MAYSSIALLSFLCVLAMDALNQIYPLIGMPDWGTNMLVALNFVSVMALLLVFNKLPWKGNIPSRSLLVLQLFWLWSLMTFIRGVGNAQDYWDWKILLLVYLPSILISIAVVLGVNFKYSAKIFRFVLFKLLPVSFIFIPFTLEYTDEFYARLVMPVCVLVLISPYLQKKWQILVVVVALLSIAMDVSYRANALRVIIPLILLLLFYFRPVLKPKLMNWILAGLFFVPLVFLSLGVSGNFNIFAENKLDYEVGTVLQGESGTSNVSSDTRTFLYREVFNSMLYRDSSFIVGEGGAAGYETDYFVDAVLNEKGRYRSEVGFLNTLMYSGAIGVLLYALVLFVPAYYAINKSNNRLCKMMGLFLAARWALYFVEEISQFDMNFFFLWLMIGLCLSNKFRAMTDAQLASYFGASHAAGSPAVRTGARGRMPIGGQKFDAADNFRR